MPETLTFNSNPFAGAAKFACIRAAAGGYHESRNIVIDVTSYSAIVSYNSGSGGSQTQAALRLDESRATRSSREGVLRWFIVELQV
jgi:hypothetical protein